VQLCREVRDEFLFLHDLYVNMIVSTLTFVAERAGEGKLGEALEYQFEKAVGPLLEEFPRPQVRDKASFLALKIFGVDHCNRTGLPRGKFTVEETGQALVFKLDPCGSGGRLYRAGAYQAMSLRRRGREALVDFVFSAACKYLPLPEGLLAWTFADRGGYVTQRKPYGQAITRSGQPWSFGRKGLPLYCCQCGMLQQKLGTDCLTISPPRSASAPCIWRLEKA